MARSFLLIDLAAALALLLGPKYTRPAAPVPPSYQENGSAATSEWKQAEPGDTLSRGKWWERFEDPQLNVLEEQLDVSNQNIAAAAANLLASRAMIREARSQYFPSLAVAPSIMNSRSSTAFGRELNASFTTYSLPLQASWGPRSKNGCRQYSGCSSERGGSGKRKALRTRRPCSVLFRTAHSGLA